MPSPIKELTYESATWIAFAMSGLLIHTDFSKTAVCFAFIYSCLRAGIFVLLQLLLT
jgi:hypothetical protein